MKRPFTPRRHTDEPKDLADLTESRLGLGLGLTAAVVLMLLFVHLVYQNVARGERVRAEQQQHSLLALVRSEAVAEVTAAPGRAPARVLAQEVRHAY